jgi:hypothetical protein
MHISDVGLEDVTDPVDIKAAFLLSLLQEAKECLRID